MKKTVSAMLLVILCAAASYSQSNTDKIKDGIAKVYASFNSGELSGIDKFISESYIEHTLPPGYPATREGLKSFMTDFRKAFPDLHFEINDMIITDTKAAVLSTMTGTNSGPFMGMPATNKKVTIMGIDYLLFNKDAICTEHWGYEDDMSMMQQLGMMNK